MISACEISSAACRITAGSNRDSSSQTNKVRGGRGGGGKLHYGDLSFLEAPSPWLMKAFISAAYHLYLYSIVSSIIKKNLMFILTIIRGRLQEFGAVCEMQNRAFCD